MVRLREGEGLRRGVVRTHEILAHILSIVGKFWHEQGILDKQSDTGDEKNILKEKLHRV